MSCALQLELCHYAAVNLLKLQQVYNKFQNPNSISVILVSFLIKKFKTLSKKKKKKNMAYNYMYILHYINTV